MVDSKVLISMNVVSKIVQDCSRPEPKDIK